jgi:hypothetical protein
MEATMIGLPVRYVINDIGTLGEANSVGALREK